MLCVAAESGNGKVRFLYHHNHLAILELYIIFMQSLKLFYINYLYKGLPLKLLMAAQKIVLEYKGIVTFLSVMITYFLLMDISLYNHNQIRTPVKYQIHGLTDSPNSPFLNGNESNSNSPTQMKYYSPFNSITVKTMMMDHINLYVLSIAANIFNKVTHLSDRHYFITPNIISGMHLLVAILAAKFASSERLIYRQFGVLLFELRTFLDCLDGIVARARFHILNNISMYGSLGHFIDGFTDTIGTTAFIVGISFFFKSQLGNTNIYSLLPSWNNNIRIDEHEIYTKSVNSKSGQFASVTLRKVVVVALCFGAQVGISGILWDRFVASYSDLLESPPSNDIHGILQNEILKSSVMWCIIWLWKLCNAHALTEYLLFSVFIDKAWEFLTWIQYIGFLILGCLFVLTQIHYFYVRSYVSASSVSTIFNL